MSRTRFQGAHSRGTFFALYTHRVSFSDPRSLWGVPISLRDRSLSLRCSSTPDSIQVWISVHVNIYLYKAQLRQCLKTLETQPGTLSSSSLPIHDQPSGWTLFFCCLMKPFRTTQVCLSPAWLLMSQICTLENLHLCLYVFLSPTAAYKFIFSLQSNLP